jgi:hypothetical protein
MRIKALILLVPFVVFITETFSVIPVMAETCVVVKVKPSTCCMKQQNKAQRQCPAKKKCDKNKGGMDCEGNPGCTACPVCYLFILQPQYEWQPAVFTTGKNYSSLTTVSISFYSNSVWKPPNGLVA